jgi:S1-C subfamily serine protease
MKEAGKRGCKQFMLRARIWVLQGRKVSSPKDLFAILDECRVGDVVEVEVERGHETAKLKVTLQERQKMGAFE